MSFHTTKNGAAVSMGFNGDSTVGIGSSATGVLDLYGTVNTSGELSIDSSLTLADSIPIKFGTGSDMQVKYNGTADYLTVEPVTTGLWSGCPSPMDPDPFKVFGVFDDFIMGGISATAPIPLWDYISDGATGTPAFRTDVAGGVMNLPTAAADNDYHAIASPSASFDIVSAKAIWFEARFKLAEATTNDSAWWFGLTSDLTTGGFQANNAGPLATYDGVMVWKDEDAMAVLSETSNAGTQATNTTMGTFVSDTWTRVGFYVDATATTATVSFYTDLDGAGPLTKFGTTKTVTRAGMVPMYLVAGVKAGPGGAAETLQIDYIKCVQVR